ncbi:MAG: phytanoyl-CoA dioxygenase family protein [Thermoanaerobaculia bacterium]
MPQIAEALVEQFISEGYCVLERAIPGEELATIVESCDSHLARQLDDMARAGADVLGLSHKDKRYFLSCRHEGNRAMEQLLFGERMAEIVGTLLGGDAFLFLELFIVKARRTGMSFGWHQDSGYLLGNQHAPYLSLWCALDDVTAENGALHVLPYDRAGTREVVPHQKERDSGDFVGFRGDDPGIVVPVPRGSIVALSSTLFHRSGPNTTDAPRRAFLASYSSLPITDAKGRIWEQAVPFLRSGVRVHGM